MIKLLKNLIFPLNPIKVSRRKAFKILKSLSSEEKRVLILIYDSVNGRLDGNLGHDIPESLITKKLVNCEQSPDMGVVYSLSKKCHYIIDVHYFR